MLTLHQFILLLLLLIILLGVIATVIINNITRGPMLTPHFPVALKVLPKLQRWKYRIFQLLDEK